MESNLESQNQDRIRDLALSSENWIQQLVFEKLLEDEDTPENRKCFDCGIENPRWASIKTGTLICVWCSGFHRCFTTND